MSISVFFSEIEKGIDKSIALGNFLDRVYYFDGHVNEKEEIYDIIKEEPGFNKSLDPLYYYLMAAVVEQLCVDFGIRQPKWINEPRFITKEPVHFRIGDNNREDDVWLVLYSPAVFKSRNIFVSDTIMNRM